MQDLHVYEYAVIRIVPRVDRGECINVGVILFSKSLNYIGIKYKIDENRTHHLFPEADIILISKNLKSLSDICCGNVSESSAIAKFDIPSRFRWLTAKRSTIIQCSDIHPGLTVDPKETLEDLFIKMVM